MSQNRISKGATFLLCVVESASDVPTNQTSRFVRSTYNKANQLIESYDSETDTETQQNARLILKSFPCVTTFPLPENLKPDIHSGKITIFFNQYFFINYKNYPCLTSNKNSFSQDIVTTAKTHLKKLPVIFYFPAVTISTEQQDVLQKHICESFTFVLLSKLKNLLSKQIFQNVFKEILI